MDKILRKFALADLEMLREETYCYWRGRTPAERFEATWELSRDQYADYYRRKGIVHAEGAERSFTRIQRSTGEVSK